MRHPTNLPLKELMCALVLLLSLGLQACAPAATQPAPASAPAPAANAIEPKAIAVLEAACARLATAQTMSFTAVNTYQKAARNGQPLFYTTLNRVSMQRPDKLRVITPGDGVGDEFYFDGKIMMAFVPSADLVAIDEAPATIDDLVEKLWQKSATYYPFADVITSDPCAVLKKNMTSAFYVGRSGVVGGTTTDMIALAGPNIQAEMWIGTQDQLPRMIKVTYPNEPGRALYQTEYSNWRINLTHPPGHFTSAKAANAKRMPFQPPGPPGEAMAPPMR